ncbi:MAG: hypothetical protein DI568_13785 [Sphingomonas sp.]|nr:MAG: hypothetical protein DI568_13785 [Sphingomonas sp.]
MSLPEFYSHRFRQEMLCHPVWLPGQGVVPGDIGIMRDGIFHREGSYTDYGAATAIVEEEEIPVSARSKFSVGISLSLSLGAEATVDPNAKVGGKLNFKRGGGVLLHVSDQRRRYIRNLREVMETLPWGSQSFGRDTVFVSEVRLAKAIALVLSESGDTGVELTGKAKALQQLDIADASVAFGATSAASYTTAIRDPAGVAFYPYGLLLYRARTGWWQDGKVVPLESDSAAKSAPDPFAEVSPYDEDL